MKNNKAAKIMMLFLMVLAVFFGKNMNVKAAEGWTTQDYINYAKVEMFRGVIVQFCNGTEVLEDVKFTDLGNGYYRIETPQSYYSRIHRNYITVDESYFFDHVRYAAENPDVAAVVGTGKAALWNHYKTFGVYEGRPAHGTSATCQAKELVIGVATQISATESTDMGRIKAAHDWLAAYAEYDTNHVYGESTHHMACLMLNRMGVCSAYAETFSYCMSVMGYRSYYVTGDTPYGSHAWNAFKIGGEWKMVDVTWDDRGEGRSTGYDYYLVPEDGQHYRTQSRILYI